MREHHPLSDAHRSRVQHLGDEDREDAADELRDDVAPEELATFCLHALTAAGSLRSKIAVRRLVSVTLAGLRPAR